MAVCVQINGLVGVEFRRGPNLAVIVVVVAILDGFQLHVRGRHESFPALQKANFDVFCLFGLVDRNGQACDGANE